MNSSFISALFYPLLVTVLNDGSLLITYDHTGIRFHRNVTLSLNPIFTFAKYSLLECAILSTEKTWFSFAWHEVKGLCNLNNDGVSGIHLSDGSNPGWTFYTTLCPTTFTYSEEITACFKLVVEEVDWNVANNTCYSYGGSLIKVDSVNKNDFVVDKMKKYGLSGLWIQGRMINGKFWYDDGTEYSYTNWYTDFDMEIQASCYILNMMAQRGAGFQATGKGADPEPDLLPSAPVVGIISKFDYTFIDRSTPSSISYACQADV